MPHFPRAVWECGIGVYGEITNNLAIHLLRCWQDNPRIRFCRPVIRTWFLSASILRRHRSSTFLHQRIRVTWRCLFLVGQKLVENNYSPQIVAMSFAISPKSKGFCSIESSFIEAAGFQPYGL